MAHVGVISVLMPRVVVIMARPALGSVGVAHVGVVGVLMSIYST